MQIEARGNMWARRRFSSLFSSLSPTPSSSSSQVSHFSTPSPSSISEDYCQSRMPCSTSTQTSILRMSSVSSSSASPSRSSSSSTSSLPSISPSSLSLPSLPSPSWMRTVMLVVILLLSTLTVQTIAVDPVMARGGGARGGGSVVSGADARPHKPPVAVVAAAAAAAPVAPNAGNSRVDANRGEGIKSIVKVQSQLDGSNADAVRAAVKKMDTLDKGNRARNFKEQTFQGNLKKDGLLKQLQDHEQENNLKQEEMKKRELDRQQRLTEQLQQQQQQQQQQRVDEDRVRRERQEQREQEQKWLVDMQRKAAEKVRQQRLQAAVQEPNNNKAANVAVTPASKNNVKSNNNMLKNNVPVTAAKPAVAATAAANIAGRGVVVMEQKQKPINPPVIEVVAASENKFEGGGVDNNEFPRLHNRKHNKKYDNELTNNNNDKIDNLNSDNGNVNNNHQAVPIVSNNDNDNNVGEKANDNNKFFDNNNDDSGRNINQNDQPYNVNRGNDFNVNNFNNNPPPREGPQMGGININWDWEDFSIMFENYGGAEMKVRRAPHATNGEPWPMPQYYSKKDNKVYRVSRDLRFMPTGHTCDILEEAMARHLQRVLRGSVEDMYDNLQHAEGTNIKDPTLKYETDEYTKAPVITRVELRVRKACVKYPSLEMDESYDLVVKKKRTFIYANEVWGLLRGLETLGQLVWRGTDGILYIKETVISDYPRFAHRGLHIDTSRHYLFKEVLLDIMDSMEMNKMNVFHWHIVDDMSFPYESKVYPELSRKGAYHPTYIYTLDDVAELVEYARMRGIRVVPEFDTPGHTYSWGLSRPELLTQCFSGNTPVTGYLGPMDPSKNSTYRFLSTLFQEIMDVFKDQFMHLGGDEVPLGCWQSNPEVMAFANELNRKHQEVLAKQPSLSQQQQQNYNYGGSWSMWSEEIKRVYEYYENRLIKLLNEIGRKRKNGVRYIMWQEVMNNNLQLPNDTIIQVWMGDMGDVMRATSLGYNVLYSTCWYLDHIEYGTKWPKYYHCDPVDQSYGYHIDEKKVLGGEAAFWSEYFSNENLIPLMWPRASAVAERLWSNKEVKNLDKAAARLSEHRCRMIKRGINAGEISGPGYCLHSPPKRRLFNDTIGCKGGNCSRMPNFVEIEDIQVHLSQRGGGLSECGNGTLKMAATQIFKVFSRGDTGVLILLTMICLLVLFMVTVTRPSSRLGRMRHCKNRSILMVFVFLLVVYFLCYTTIGLRAFEFSGSIHKTFQEDKRGQGKDGFQDQKRLLS